VPTERDEVARIELIDLKEESRRGTGEEWKKWVERYGRLARGWESLSRKGAGGRGRVEGTQGSDNKNTKY
jgi:hypothetical protein